MSLVSLLLHKPQRLHLERSQFVLYTKEGGGALKSQAIELIDLSLPSPRETE